MKRKQRTVLPRVTVLAMSRKELVSFATAVNDIRTLKLELEMLVRQLGDQIERKGRKAKGAPAIVPEPLGVPTPNGEGGAR